jgi:dolichol-phosphate mannosyltransferase
MEILNAQAAKKTEGGAAIPSFAVLLPMYNEADGVAACINNLSTFLTTVSARTAIIAVNDGSTDGTGRVLAELQDTIPCLFVETHERNRGYGAANRTGYVAACNASFDYVLVMDSDGTQNPDDIARFFSPMIQGVDLIKATRYAKGGKVIGVSWQRVLNSVAGNWLARLILRLPITDFTNGFRALRVDLLARMTTTDDGFSMLIEEVVGARGLSATFAEVPYTLTSRRKPGASKFVYSYKTYWSYLRHLVLSVISGRSVPIATRNQEVCLGKD